jgi:hypothetical protein
MTVLADVRVIPQHIRETYMKLKHILRIYNNLPAGGRLGYETY